MILTVGTNSYVTLEEADSLITDTKRAYHPLRVAWTALDSNEKSQLLSRSAKELDTLNFIGRKFNFTQKMAFPRIRSGATPFILSHNPLYVMHNEDASQIPEVVKQAQVENALALLQERIKKSSNLTFLQELGVAVPDTERKGSIASVYAEQLLQGWIGGYRG